MYRNDLEAAHNRIAALEKEMKQLREEILVKNKKKSSRKKLILNEETILNIIGISFFILCTVNCIGCFIFILYLLFN